MVALGDGNGSSQRGTAAEPHDRRTANCYGLIAKLRQPAKQRATCQVTENTPTRSPHRFLRNSVSAAVPLKNSKRRVIQRADRPHELFCGADCFAFCRRFALKLLPLPSSLLLPFGGCAVPRSCRSAVVPFRDCAVPRLCRSAVVPFCDAPLPLPLPLPMPLAGCAVH